MSRFKPAQRQKKKLRFAIDGPAGSGKTYTGVAFAVALARYFNPTNPRVAVICSERGSASLYQGIRENPDTEPWSFDLLQLHTFAPTEYTSAIEEAGREGYDALLIDSLSHAWAGKDGALELKEKSGDKNSFTAWKTITPMHNAMVDAILQSPCHVLVTMRSKIEYVLEPNDKGQMVPRRIGTAPVQRYGMEYEFDLYGSMDWSHILTISKSRCPQAADAVVVKPGGAWILPIAQWLATGEDVDVQAAVRKQRASTEQVEQIIAMAMMLRKPKERFEADLTKRYGVSEVASLRPDQAEELIIRLTKEAETMAPPVATPTPTTAPAPEPTPSTNGHAPTPAPEEAGQTLHDALAEAAANDPAIAPRVTDSQLTHLRGLVNRLQTAGVLTTDKWADMMKRRKVERASELSEKQADALIQQLGAKVNELNQQEAKEPASPN